MRACVYACIGDLFGDGFPSIVLLHVIGKMASRSIMHLEHGLQSGLRLLNAMLLIGCLLEEVRQFGTFFLHLTLDDEYLDTFTFECRSVARITIKEFLLRYTMVLVANLVPVETFSWLIIGRTNASLDATKASLGVTSGHSQDLQVRFVDHR